MRGRLLILIGLIVLVAVIAVFIVNSGILNQQTTTVVQDGNVVVQPPPGATLAPTPTPIPLVRIVQALQNLPRGFRFPDQIEELENIVGYALWPEEAVPFNALREDQGGLEQVLGKIARTDIFREQPILSTLMVDDLEQIAAVGSDAAAVLPNGLVAVALPVDRTTSVAYAVQDGDRVDLIISMLFVDVDEVFQSITPNKVTLFQITDQGIETQAGIEGRPEQSTIGPVIIGPSERQRPRLVTQRTIQDALVVHIGEFPLDGKFIGELPTPTPVPATAEAGGGTAGTPPPPPTAIPKPDIVTLGVTPQNAVVIVWAIESRLPVTMALRSAGDTSRTSTQQVTMDYVMSEFRIDLPARRDYSIEPAIRSIRQLLAGNFIGLSEDAQAVIDQTGQ
jgi:Flp pilus assembly protein CpaB